MKKFGLSLSRIIEIIPGIRQIEKNDLKSGDQVFIFTGNSVYDIKKVDEKIYRVSGGWFDQNNISPCKISIRGCTWGGSIIHINLLAAIGLSIEFNNNLVTSPVSKIVVFKSEMLN